MQYMKKQKGFTLVEVVTSIAVGLVIIAAIYAAVNMAQRSTVNIERRVAAHQDARAALVLMSLEIQMASYNPDPTYETGAFWVASGACTTPSGNQNYRGIQVATDSSITVEMNKDGSSVIGDATNEVVTYVYDSANQYITRSTNCGGNMPFLGDMPGDPRAVRVINTAEVPVFQYFNAQGTQIASSGLPAGIQNIARIGITLWVETEDVDPNSGQRRRMVYSTSVIPRNHVIKQ
jgi:prepilin-type N-terminal cleavage/methylation domain-containing protein